VSEIRPKLDGSHSVWVPTGLRWCGRQRLRHRTQCSGWPGGGRWLWGVRPPVLIGEEGDWAGPGRDRGLVECRGRAPGGCQAGRRPVTRATKRARELLTQA
jgi:hypothetical protein